MLKRQGRNWVYSSQKIRSICYVVLVLFLIAGCGKSSDIRQNNEEAIIDTVKTYINKNTFYPKEKIDYTQYEIRTVKEQRAYSNQIVIGMGQKPHPNYFIVPCDRC